jgi:hypothetical protein
MLFDKKDGDRFTLISCSKVELSKKKIISSVLFGALVSTAVTAVAFGAASYMNGKKIYDSFSGELRSEKLSLADVKDNLLGTESLQVAARFGLKDGMIDGKRLIIDSSDSNLPNIIGALESKFVGVHPDTNREMNNQERYQDLNIFNKLNVFDIESNHIKLADFLASKSSPPQALTKTAGDLSICYLAADKRFVDLKKNNIAGINYNDDGNEFLQFVRHHEEGHCLDMENRGFKGEVVSDLVASALNASITGNFDFAKYVTLTSRLMAAHDHEHQSSLALEKMFKEIDPLDLFGKSEGDVVAVVHDFVSAKFTDDLTPTDSMKKSQEILFFIDEAVENTGGVIDFTKDSKVEVISADEIKNAVAFGQDLLKKYVDRESYRGRLDKSDYKESVFIMAAKLAKLTNNRVLQIEMNYHAELVRAGVNTSVEFALNPLGIQEQHELSIRQIRNEGRIADYREKLSEDLVKNVRSDRAKNPMSVFPRHERAQQEFVSNLIKGPNREFSF